MGSGFVSGLDRRIRAKDFGHDLEKVTEIHLTVFDLTKVQPEEVPKLIQLALSGGQVIPPKRSSTFAWPGKLWTVLFSLTLTGGVALIGEPSSPDEASSAFHAGGIVLLLLSAVLLLVMVVLVVSRPDLVERIWGKDSSRCHGPGPAIQVHEVARIGSFGDIPYEYETASEVRLTYSEIRRLASWINAPTLDRLSALAYNTQAQLAFHVRATRESDPNATQFRVDANEALSHLRNAMAQARFEATDASDKQQRLLLPRRDDELAVARASGLVPVVDSPSMSTGPIPAPTAEANAQDVNGSNPRGAC